MSHTLVLGAQLGHVSRKLQCHLVNVILEWHVALGWGLNVIRETNSLQWGKRVGSVVLGLYYCLMKEGSEARKWNLWAKVLSHPSAHSTEVRLMVAAAL